MKTLRALYHFLGGVHFAIILIAATAFFVIVGTLLESVTQSHRYAALFTYDTPLFAALLWGFLINIFVSAIRRWPFRWKHIPFLTTHLGLLMILAGVLAKHYYGLQGSMTLLEGTGSQEILEAYTYAIQLNKKGEKTPLRYPLKKTISGSFSPEIAHNDQGMTIHLIEYAPHCEQRLASWIKGAYATIRGLEPFKLHHVGEDKEKLPVNRKVRFHPHSPPWDVYALKTSHLESTLEALAAQHQYSTPLFAMIQEDNGNVHLLAFNQGKVCSESYPQGKLESLIAYDEGFLGYATRTELPFSIQQEGISMNQLEFRLRQAIATGADLPMPLKRLQASCDSSGVDFPEAAAAFLLPLLQEYQASLNDQEATPLHATPLILETTVIAEQEILPPEKKLEDNIPKATFLIRKGKQAQTISLAYDKTGSGLKWPVLDGQYMVRFQPQFKEIPYRLRLRQARQINYPNSSQAYSFESDIIITDRRSMTTKEQTISMNHVHETWDGYRFYLSAMAPPDESAVKQVNIVVNYDPAKYFLTYPGAFVLSFGILMLFIMRRNG